MCLLHLKANYPAVSLMITCLEGRDIFSIRTWRNFARGCHSNASGAKNAARREKNGEEPSKHPSPETRQLRRLGYFSIFGQGDGILNSRTDQFTTCDLQKSFDFGLEANLCSGVNRTITGKFVLQSTGYFRSH